MHLMYGLVFLLAVALVLALLLYAFLTRQGSAQKTLGKGEPPMQKLRPGKGSASKTKVPEKALKKPSSPVPVKDRLSPGGRLAVEGIRVVAQEDVDRIVRLIRRWMQEK